MSLNSDEVKTLATLGNGVLSLVTRKETIYDGSGFRAIVWGANQETLNDFKTRKEAEDATVNLAVTVCQKMLAEAKALRKKRFGK